ncbi:transposable element Tc1 transposase [Trichonephila clavipes]|nr:transposable element Tc1 transposase [Trichonephila clavipes]
MDPFGSPCTLVAERYFDDILPPVVLPFLLQHPGLTFQHNNAQSHMTRIGMNCLQACPTLLWPAGSPNLFLANLRLSDNHMPIDFSSRNL